MCKNSIGHIRKMARNILKEYFSDHQNIIKPIPIDDIAKKFNIEIHYLDSLEKSHKAIKHISPEDGRLLIGINKHYHIHSQRFSIGHELGHHFLGHPPESKYTNDEIICYNHEADEFSAEILMPLSELKQALKKDSIDDIAKALCVSRDALFIKIKNSNLLRYI